MARRTDPQAPPQPTPDEPSPEPVDDTTATAWLEPFEIIPAPFDRLLVEGHIEIFAFPERVRQVLSPILRQTYSLVTACRRVAKQSNDASGDLMTVDDALAVVKAYLWCADRLLHRSRAISKPSWNTCSN